MSQPSFFLKAAALASSVVFVGAFVCYSAGAFDFLKEKPVQAAPGTEEVAPPSSTPDPVFIPSSKSIILRPVGDSAITPKSTFTPDIEPALPGKSGKSA